MDKISLLKVGSVCAVCYSIGLVVLLVVLGTSPMTQAEGVLPALAAHPTTVATVGWLLVVLPLLLAMAGLGFSHALRQVGSLIWVATAAFVGGAFLTIFRGFLWLAMTYELAPAYVAAPEGTKEALAVVGDTLESFAHIAGDLVGGVLMGGVGVLLYSLAILHTSFAPRWVAWLGVFVALSAFAAFVTVLLPLTQVFELINFISAVTFFFWMIAMGVALWRTPEHTSA